jgi:hypothetical protein
MASLPFLDPVIQSSDGTSFERLDSITDFRQCHGVVPLERRILYRCRRLSSSSPPSTTTCNAKDDYILKVKVQIPDPDSSPTSHPETPAHSNATNHELDALKIFRDASTAYAPRLVAFETLRQSPEGLLPEGYISCTIMSKLPGKSLFDLGYWSLGPEDREKIQQQFLEALTYVDSSRNSSTTAKLTLPQSSTQARHRAWRQRAEKRDVGSGDE